MTKTFDLAAHQVQWDARKFYAKVMSGRRVAYQTGPHQTREAAEKDCFAAIPAAKECQSWQGFYSDIRWRKQDYDVWTRAKKEQRKARKAAP